MKIVVLDGFALNPGDLCWDSLYQLGDVTIYDRTPTDKILERAKGAEILLTNKTLLMSETITKLPQLKYIGVLATGFNVVDIKAARENGIIVTNIPAYSTNSVAQLVFALLLELCHGTGEHNDAVHRGEWTNSKDFCFWKSPLIELAGKTMGIIGFGQIGRQVAAISAAMGMNVLASSRSKSNAPDIANFKWAEIPEILSQSDVISLHCPLTEETKGLINKESIKLMKNSAFLINTSRGPVIVDDDVADALNNDLIAGAGIDVMTTEPPKADNPLLTAKNCIITPHIAWATKEARIRLMKIAVDNVNCFLKRKPENVVS